MECRCLPATRRERSQKAINSHIESPAGFSIETAGQPDPDDDRHRRAVASEASPDSPTGRSSTTHFLEPGIRSTRSPTGRCVGLLARQSICPDSAISLAGLVLARDEELIDQLNENVRRNLRAQSRLPAGPVLNAGLLDARVRGGRWAPADVTLRMNRQSKNAQRIAESLASHKRVGIVNYPSTL